jgi:hypothetical protein
MTVQNNDQFGTHNVIMFNNVLVNDSRGGFCTNDVYNVVVDKSNVNTPQSCISLSYAHGHNITNNICISGVKKLFQEKNVLNIYKFNNTLAPQPSDPTCVNGIIKNNICCASSCGQCGGSGCSSLTGGASKCCTSTIANSGISCNNAIAPCILQSTFGRKLLM